MGRKSIDQLKREKETKRVNAWARKETVRVALRFNLRNDADIIECLNNKKNKTAYIKKLIRDDLKEDQ